MTYQFQLAGLSCPHCAAEIERELLRLPEIDSAAVSLVGESLTVESSANREKLLQAICETVQKTEPRVRVLPQPKRESAKSNAQRDSADTRRRIRLAVGAGVFVVGYVLLLCAEGAAWMARGILLVGYVLLGADVLWRAVRNILRGKVFDENFLMALSTVGALVIGEYPEAVAVMLFYQIGEYFQDMAVGRSRRSIASLMNIRPDTAVVLRDGKPLAVAPQTVAVGEKIVIKAGERIPLDGVVVEGAASVDMSALTGESVPQFVEVGDQAISGCINRDGTLVVRVEKAFAESTATRILELVENAASRKAPSEQRITTFSRYYTPIVVMAALLLALVPPLFVGGFAHWIRRGFVFLVISCPCALVISVPLAFFAGIGAASRQGVLVKGGNYLEALGKAKTVVFDKTGTLTEGVFAVQTVLPANGYLQQEVLTLAAHAEAQSTHPIARSVMAAFGKEVEQRRISSYHEVAGKGVRAGVDGRTVLVGNEAWMRENGISVCNGQDGTVLYVAENGTFAGSLSFADAPKKDSASAIRALRACGIKRCVMLTGDNERAAAQTAKALSLEEYHAGLLPAQKLEKLELLEKAKKAGETVVFVGDGLNDAPVLARADVGVAMGGLGTDAAIEAADVVLMTDEPSKLVQAIAIARKTGRIVTQNIVFALAVKAVFLLLGALGIAGMWVAVFGDVGVMMLAVLNSMRMIRR